MPSAIYHKCRNLAAILMARPGTEGVWAALLQSLLILASPIFYSYLMYEIAKFVEPFAWQFWGGWNYDRFSSYKSDNSISTHESTFVFLAIGSFAGLFLCFTYLIYGFASPLPGRTVLRFIRHGWMTAIVYIVASLNVFYVILLLPPTVQPMQWPSPFSELSRLIPIILLVLGPTLLAWAEYRGMNKIAWRPQCPECAHSIKHSRERCSECGDRFPTPNRRFRRWAVQRLPWERKRRGFVIGAYLRMLAGIAFMPRKFATGASVPDQMGRAWRWAVFHMLLVAIVVASIKYAPRWYYDVVLPYSDALARSYEGPDLGHYAVWASQTAALWFAAQVSYLASAIILLNLMPGTIPAARRTMLKWALYCMAAIPLIEILALGIEIAGALPRSTTRTYTVWWQALWWDWQQMTRPPELLVAMAYGWLWSAGCSSNRWISWRGCTTWMTTFAAYLGIWLILVELLFRIGAIKELF